MENSDNKEILTVSKSIDNNTTKDQDSFKFFNSVKTAVKSNNIKQLEQLLISPDFPNMSKLARENTVFNMVFFNENKAFIDFLIFDYKIERNPLIDSFYEKNEWLKNKFDKRDTAIEIENELPINGINNKKLKV